MQMVLIVDLSVNLPEPCISFAATLISAGMYCAFSEFAMPKKMYIQSINFDNFYLGPQTSLVLYHLISVARL